eukprot:67165_1
MNVSLAIIAISCITFSFLCMLWIIYQCVHFVNNTEIQQHQAFKIRGRRMFLLTAVIMILNFIFRPMLVSISLVDLVAIDSNFWRAVMDIAQMSLYAIIEFRCWITYFTLMSRTAIIDKQWKKYLHYAHETRDCFFHYRYLFSNPCYVGTFFAAHGVLCVVICGFVEEYQSYDPHRIIAHFFTANILMFLLFIHRMYTSYIRTKHSYCHDMLSVNKELNLITDIMTVTAICDSALGVFVSSIILRHVFYVIYQTILIIALSVIIFYLPQKTIYRLMLIENSAPTPRDGHKSATLQAVFADKDLYHSFIRFTLEEWCVENVLFITQWMQIQKLIVDSGIDVEVNSLYSCESSETDKKSSKMRLFELPSDE